MSFANPLGLLLLLALPVIVLLHLFRQERRRREVSSLYLWREITDQQSRRVRPRLLRNVNLLLQLLAALFAAFALAGPRITVGATAGTRDLIVLLDDSASMRAPHGRGTRFALARDRAQSLIDRSVRGRRILLATAGPAPRVVHPFTTDRTALAESLRTLEPTDGANDLPGALRLVRGLTEEAADVVLVTDGALRPDPETTLPERFAVERVGATVDAPPNLAVTTFELRERPDGSAFEVLTGVASFAAQPASTELELLGAGRLLTSREIELEPGEERLVSAVVPRELGAVYEARLAANDDALAVDDRAFAASAGERPVRIQLVTPGNLFLESFLAVYPRVELRVTEQVLTDEPFDILILDRVPAPARLSGNVVAFGTALPGGPFAAGDAVRADQAVSVRGEHPLVRDVRLDQVRLGTIVTGELDPRATVLAAAGDRPVLYTFRDGRLTLVGTTFSLTESDLALRGSFPVLMHNIVEWLAPIAPAGAVGSSRPGDVVPLFVPPGEEVVVIRPDEVALRFTPRTTPFEFAGTSLTGVYEVRGESFRSRFAVSLTDASESNLTARLGGVVGPDEDGPDVATGLPIWQWLALAALLLLVADWIVWARRH